MIAPGDDGYEAARRVWTTGIGGLTLGGGYGWLGRRHGLVVDNLLSADVVTADGKLLTASKDENADLFWGLRGGGGNFGIVTSFEYRLHPIGPMVFGGALFYPVERAAEFLRFLREWTRTIPHELAVVAALLDAPAAPFVPEELQGTPMIGIAICYTGPLEEGEKAIKALRDFGAPAIDLAGPIPYTALQGMFDLFYPHGICSYWKTEHLDELSDDAVEATLAHFAKKTSPLSQFFIEHLEGALTRAPEDEMAFSHRDASYPHLRRHPVDRSCRGRDPHRLGARLVAGDQAVLDRRCLPQLPRRGGRGSCQSRLRTREVRAVGHS